VYQPIVGVMKGEEIKFEEIEVSHTLGGVGDDTFLSYTLRYVSLTDLDRLYVISVVIHTNSPPHQLL
jgi:hypothetical protein